MALELIPAYDRQDEVRELFTEYTHMLVELDPKFQESLDEQNYDEELEQLQELLWADSCGEDETVIVTLCVSSSLSVTRPVALTDTASVVLNVITAEVLTATAVISTCVVSASTLTVYDAIFDANSGDSVNPSTASEARLVFVALGLFTFTRSVFPLPLTSVVLLGCISTLDFT